MNNIKILYEDNHLLVVIKPENVLSQKDNTNDKDMLTILKEYIKKEKNKKGNVYLGLVHRLDRPVGGIMVFAKTSKAAGRLSKQINENKMHKSYYAVIHGYLDNNKGTLENTIYKTDNKLVIMDTSFGKKAVLNYKVLKKENNLSLLDIDLLTGRYHQIRLQFAIRNHPLYGDQLYGNKDNKQIALFAYKLEFYHPITNELMSFSAKPTLEIFKKFLK